MIGYKLFRRRSDGTLGSLFINRQQRLQVGETYPAEDHPTKGFAHRPGWHICSKPEAPHLSMRDRYWYVVEFHDFRRHKRPICQGGMWFTANRMRIIRPLPPTDSPSSKG